MWPVAYQTRPISVQPTWATTLSKAPSASLSALTPPVLSLSRLCLLWLSGVFLRDKTLAHFTHEQNGGAGGGRENRTLMAEEMPHPVTPPPAAALDWSVPKVGVFTKRKN